MRSSATPPQQRPLLRPPAIIDNAKGMVRLGQSLQSTKRLAVDTESNSLFAYQERVCLIQLSTDSADFLVDPLRGAVQVGLGFLGELFANPRIEKVLHAAEYDVMTLRRDFGFTFENLFDTMIATRILGWERVGLGALLEDHFGVQADKRHQRANWGRRPLSRDMIRYAQIDTHYLLPLRDKLYGLLREGGHLEEARELFNEVARAEWGGVEFDPQGYWRLNGINGLSPRETAVLEALYHYREQEARRRNLPVFKVLSDELLVSLSSLQPQRVAELKAIRGVSQGILERYGSGLLNAIRHGQEAPVPARPKRLNQPDEMVQRRFDALHNWRKERAAQRGVSSEVVMPKDALWELAQAAPQTRADLEAIQSLGPWRARTYGGELLNVLSTVSSQNGSSPHKGA